MARSPLEELSELSRQGFPNLLAARQLTAEQLDDRRAKLSELPADDDTTVVLMGSWGRQELTSESDDDFMVLVDGSAREVVRPSIEDVRSVLTRPPSPGGPFGAHVFCDDLVEKIGLQADDNDNLTRRMLFVLESVPATNVAVYETARSRVLGNYLDVSIKPDHVPRFFLNDTIRYWRQMCVDFAGKEREASRKWGIQNAKLRLSRKLLFAGGLLPILEAASYEPDEMREFLDEVLRTPPSDRIASSFIKHGQVDAGARAFTAYDEFLALLGDPARRERLRAVTRETASDSEEFASVHRLAHSFEAALLALLFESDLEQLVREVAIF